LKESRNSPIVIAEINILKQLGNDLRAAAKINNQVERAKAYRIALVNNEISIKKLHGQPLKSEIRSIAISLGLTVE
jgi:hypothetical protein